MFLPKGRDMHCHCNFASNAVRGVSKNTRFHGAMGFPVPCKCLTSPAQFLERVCPYPNGFVLEPLLLLKNTGKD